MTGFGVGEAALPSGRLVAEVRSVNQRFLDVRAKLPRELADLASLTEQVVRERVRRGRVEVVVHAEGSLAAPVRLDVPRAREAFRQLAALRDEIAPGAELPLSLLSAVPDLFGGADDGAAEAYRAATKACVGAALDELDRMSEREGAVISRDLAARLSLVRGHVDELAQRAGALRDVIRARLRERAERLFAGEGLAVDPARLEAECALLADKSDVAEELTRLTSHLAQFESALAEGAREPVGRRLDFLLQEMLREANTLSAKCQDALASQQVVSIKVELERLREQVQNVE
ncbi:MAG TPA: YicC/YloC family endoribonuclease [Byssovorax sp.]|jgi:uncharacterized protein (TIGR00255 family)